MSKPEDIPQDVWDATLRAIYVPGFPGGDLPTAVLESDIQAIVARAILDERERCAGKAEHYITARNARKAHDLTTQEVYEVKIFARLIAAAIRSGA